MPGGQLETGEVETKTLEREIIEELGSEVDVNSIEFISEYIDVSATSPDRDVLIRLYRGKLLNEPKPSAEIGGLHWIGKNDKKSEKISPILKNKIIPDLVSKGILK